MQDRGATRSFIGVLRARDVDLNGSAAGFATVGRDLAIRYGLTAYDASYLWLSQTENAGLLTFDKRLSRATLSN